MLASNFGGTLDQLFLWILYEFFTKDASLRLLYHGAKKSKMTKNSDQGGPRNWTFDENHFLSPLKVVSNSYSATATKSKMATPRFKKSFW